MDTIETIATWGYKPDGSAQIFDLAPGADLPEGWSPSPSVITDPSQATADALTMRATGLTFAHAVEGQASGPASEPSAVDELLAALTEIDRLKGVIEAGMAENERLASELDEADKLLGAAADSYKKATDDLAAFSEQLAKAHEDTRVNAAERDAAKAAVEALTADLAQAKADLEAATAPKPATTTKGR
ncbi:Putative kinesin K39 [Methylorubrum populi]